MAESAPTRNVLVIDYFFPPLGGPGVQRTLGYVKYLAEFGWNPTVLTVHSGEHSMYDETLLRSVPDSVRVHRAISVEPIRFAKRLLARANTRRNGGGDVSPGSGRPLWSGSPRMRQVEYWILFPDRRIGWLPFALARAIGLSRSLRVDLIYSTSTAMTSHLIAYFLKRLLGRPWVADFQDPWQEDYVSHFPTSWHRRLADRLDHLVVRDADCVTVTNESHRTMIQEKHRMIRPGKVVVIPMGFDPDAFEHIQAIRRSKFTITHLGNFYGPRSPVSFLRALRRCLDENEGLADDIEVLLVGGFDAEVLAQTELMLDQSDLRRVVRLLGIVAHDAGLGHLMASDVLLLVTDTKVGGRHQIPTKLPEYLATGKPILALTPDGESANIVRTVNAGLVVHPDDIDATRDAIFELYRRWREGSLAFPIDRDAIHKFSWKKITAQLAATLDDVLAGASA